MVDDDQRVLESLENLLESADYSVRLFCVLPRRLIESGCLAEIDCLISDIDMPVMDGLELLRVVRSARLETCPSLLITGYPEMFNRLPPVDPRPLPRIQEAVRRAGTHLRPSATH